MFGLSSRRRSNAEAHAAESAGAVVFRHRVGPGDQLLEQLAGARVVDVGGDAALVAIEVVEDAGAVHGRRAVVGRQPSAQRVEVPLVLDADHVGPEVGDDACRLRPGDDPGEIHDPHPGQWPRSLVVGTVAVRVAVRHRSSPSRPRIVEPLPREPRQAARGCQAVGLRMVRMALWRLTGCSRSQTLKRVANPV